MKERREMYLLIVEDEKDVAAQLSQLLEQE